MATLNKVGALRMPGILSQVWVMPKNGLISYGSRIQSMHFMGWNIVLG